MEGGAFTPSEAAVVSGLKLSAVHKSIDEGPLGGARARIDGKRVLSETEIVYLAATEIFDPKLVQLTERAKERLLKAISSSGGRTQKPSKVVLVEGLQLDLKPIFAKVRANAKMLAHAAKMVVINPRIRGGEPVIRGTRIGVYEVAAMAAHATQQERVDILAGYPTLQPEQLELALIFAAAYPRRGRPPKHPWHATDADARA
jgi:uncharacterized protein (DUF433 family)